MKKIYKILIILSFLLLPFNVFAYSNYVIPGGETIGIEVKSDGILIVDFYKVNNSFIGKQAGFKIGDRIIKVDNIDINSIEDMLIYIKNNNTNFNKFNFTVIRNNVKKNINFDLIREDGILKTGLYVKDRINGIGTLTYIDPENRIFGSLGHEIIDSKTLSKFEIKDGYIYNADVLDIKKSRNGIAGEKNASINKNIVNGKITENTKNGIFGKYNSDFDLREKIAVGHIDEIKIGNAKIRTVIKNSKVELFDIEILYIDKKDKTKNLLFEIKDKNLINKTGGVVQGMSGSPIIQNNKIIGAVNYVLVNDTVKGYGIFITTMLKEGDN